MAAPLPQETSNKGFANATADSFYEHRVECAMQNFRDLRFATCRASDSPGERARYADEVESQPSDVLRYAIFLDDERVAKRMLDGNRDLSLSMHHFLVAFGAGPSYCSVLMNLDAASSKKSVLTALRKMKTETRKSEEYDQATRRADAIMQSLIVEEEAQTATRGANKRVNSKAKRANGKKANGKAKATGAGEAASSSHLAARESRDATTDEAPSEEGGEAADPVPMDPLLPDSAPVDSAPVDSAPDPPDEYICPISHELMEDPVLASDGHAYERREVERWFEKKLTSPKTGEALDTSALFTNHPLRRLIVDWRESHGV